MKKTIATVLTLFMALTMVITLAACGDEDNQVTLTERSVNGLSFNVPDDIGDFEDSEGVMIAKNENATASISVSSYLDIGIIPSDVTEDYYKQTFIPKYSEVKFIEFKTDERISYADAVYLHFTAKRADGLEVEAFGYLIGIPVDDGDDLIQSVMFAFTKDADNSIKESIELIKSSLKFDLE